MTKEELLEYVGVRVSLDNPNDLITPKEVRDSILSVATYVDGNFVGKDSAGNVSIYSNYLSVVGSIVAGISYQLNGQYLAFPAGGSNTINSRIISNSSSIDGMHLGYQNMSNAPTRIYDGGVSNYINLASATFSSPGITRFLFGSQIDDGTFAQFSGDVKVRGNISVTDGFIYIKYNTASLPSSGLGGAISNNRSGGNAEVNFINTYDENPASTSFTFSQKTSATSIVDLFTIMRSGYCGIGTPSPNAKAHVVADGSGARWYDTGILQLSGTNTTQKLCIGYDVTNNFGFIQALQSGVGYVPLVINPNMGNLLVGTTTNAGFKVDVNGTARVQGAFTFSGAVSKKVRIIAGGSGTYSINTDDHTLIFDMGLGSTVPLPSASTLSGRVLILINRTAGDVATSTAYFNLSKNAVGQVQPGKSVTLQTDGTTWHQIV